MTAVDRGPASAPREGAPFIVIGENIHASRVVKVDGNRMAGVAEGRPSVRVPLDGSEALLPVPEQLRETREYRAGRVKHVLAAIHHGVTRSEHAGTAAAYIRWIARRQIEGGATYLDLNVDEASPDMDGRLAAMDWLVCTVGPIATVPLSFDSSDSAVLALALERHEPDWAAGERPLLNSAAADRMDVLEMAAVRHLPVVLSSTGASMPSGTDERMARANEIIGLATDRGLPLADLHVDPLVVPIGVDSEAGGAYLEAVRRLRTDYGTELHITGGVSNVSFGMPARRVISDVFLDMCVLAGQDSGIVDPIAANIARALAPDRASVPYQLASNLLTGADSFGVEFIEAFRAGRLATAS
jgi:5-methyltetrahydrofolate--homocysteine methyltransferase